VVRKLGKTSHHLSIRDRVPKMSTEIHIQIKLKEDRFFPSSEELQIRYKLEDTLEKQVGEIVDAGAGMGVMDIFVEVAHPDSSLKIIQSLLKEFQIEDITTVTVTKL
jgi:hypothetical protein